MRHTFTHVSNITVCHFQGRRLAFEKCQIVEGTTSQPNKDPPSSFAITSPPTYMNTYNLCKRTSRTPEQDGEWTGTDEDWEPSLHHLIQGFMDRTRQRQNGESCKHLFLAHLLTQPKYSVQVEAAGCSKMKVSTTLHGVTSQKTAFSQLCCSRNSTS